MTVVQSFGFCGPRRRASDVIHVGLVNNMPDTALRATELQFARVLKDACGFVDVRLHFFSFPEIERSELARSRMEGTYADAATISAKGIDALIVTGAEPHEADMRREPYWQSFSRMTDWAKTGTISTIFSCLAAHAAVLHLDGIQRRALPQKLSGVFDCESVADDALLFNIAPRTFVPHSRYNDLDSGELAGRGYNILSRVSDSGGANLFIKREKSIFVFLQGHPEYDETTLGREYLRDLGRYMNGERAEPPILPENYFNAGAESALRQIPPGIRSPSLLPRYAEITGQSVPLHDWRNDTVKLFANWLAMVAAEKARRRVDLAQNVPLQKLRRSA